MQVSVQSVPITADFEEEFQMMSLSDRCVTPPRRTKCELPGAPLRKARPNGLRASRHTIATLNSQMEAAKSDPTKVYGPVGEIWNIIEALIPLNRHYNIELREIVRHIEEVEKWYLNPLVCVNCSSLFKEFCSIEHEHISDEENVSRLVAAILQLDRDISWLNTLDLE